MHSITEVISQELGARAAQVEAAVRLLGRGRHGALHRPLSQGGDRRSGRRPAAPPGGAPDLSAGARGAPCHRPREHHGAGQAHRRPEAEIEQADTKQRLEDLYLPYKPKRRTKAQIAREAGLEPLAEGLLADPTQDPAQAAAAYVDAEKGVPDATAALDGARQILMERFAEDAELTGPTTRAPVGGGVLVSAGRGQGPGGQQVLGLLRLPGADR